MSWARTERTYRQLIVSLAAAQTAEQFQGIGALGRDALISLAQAVFDPAVHWRSQDAIPSATDSKRMLEAWVATRLSGGSNDELRAHLRSAVQLADALTHKRSATRKDARLSAIATESAIRLVAEVEDHPLDGTETGWEGVTAGPRYFAWDGPTLHGLDDRTPIPAPSIALDAIRALGHNPRFGLRDRLREYQARGAFQVYETDRRTWRRELLYDQDGTQVLLVTPKPPASGGAA